MSSFDGGQPQSHIGDTSSSDAGPYRVRVDIPPGASRAPLEMGDDDTVLERVQLTTRYVTHNGKPWVPVMGEYHFSRDLPERWEVELRKMKAGGVNVLATYMLWIVHEETRGDVRWDGPRDIRKFIELADEVGLKVLLRIGPWAHGETRNGGYPDWLQDLPVAHRSDDPDYLELARGWYVGIEEQVRGLFHNPENPAGPIIGIQVDNELYDNGAHLATLRSLAEEVGMAASLWTATGWGGAKLPRGRVLPVYAGYSDGFWEESDTQWPEFGIMHFTYNSVRDDLTVGADLRDAPAEISADASLGADDPWPFVTCELGGGMTVAYHRRPLVDSDDVAALALTKVGSGSAWQGYYMYHGGIHVQGELSTTQESHATAYPNDMPLRDYDFFAPLGAVGTQRPHFHKLRQQHLMLDAFGAALATSPATIPPVEEGGPRWSVRGDGTRAFLFANNHQPAIAALPRIEDVQFVVELSDRSVTIPSQPFDLDTGTYFVWPIRQSYPEIPALSVTAQPITELATLEGAVVFFAATDGVPVELQLEGVEPHDVRGAEVRVEGDVVFATPHSASGVGCEVHIGDTTLVFLDKESAEGVWRGDINGRDSVLIWRGGGWFDDGFRAVHNDSAGVIEVVPALADTSHSKVGGEGSVFSRYAVPAAAVPVELQVPPFQQHPTVPVRRGGTAGRYSAPTDQDFTLAAATEVLVPGHAFAPEAPSILTLDWVGDVIRVYVGDRLIADQYWYGRPLEVDLAPHQAELASRPLTLKAFAWESNSGVYVDSRVRPDATDAALRINSAVVRPVQTTAVR